MKNLYNLKYLQIQIQGELDWNTVFLKKLLDPATELPPCFLGFQNLCTSLPPATSPNLDNNAKPSQFFSLTMISRANLYKTGFLTCLMSWHT